MFLYEEGRVAYEDSKMEVRTNPNDSEGYTFHIKDSPEYLSFPRDTLEEIASADRDCAKNLITYLMPSFFEWERILGENNLTSDSIITALTKAHINEEKRIRELQ